MDMSTGLQIYRQIDVPLLPYNFCLTSMFSCIFHVLMYLLFASQVRLTVTVICNQYYLLSCGADGAR